MNNNVIPFNDKAQLPAHLAKMFGDEAVQENSALSGGVGPGFGVISYKGKDWALVIGGERHPLETPNGDPATSIEVIIVKANQNLSKIYYADGYVEGSQDKPDCFSNDGIRPALDAQEPRCDTCAACPMNVWGSKISDNGNKVKACTDSRRMAVVFPTDLENPYLLRVPAASLKEVAKYGSQLSERRTPFQAVVTKIGFDRTVAHPQFVLTPVRFIDEEEMEAVQGYMNSDLIEQMVGLNADPVHEGEIATEAKPAAAKRVTPTTQAPKAVQQVQPRTRAAARPAPAPAPDEPEEDAQEAPARRAEPAQATRARRQVAPRQTVAQRPAADEEGDEAPAPAKPTLRPPPAAQRRAAAPSEEDMSNAVEQSNAELDDILGSLDD